MTGARIDDQRCAARLSHVVARMLLRVVIRSSQPSSFG
jgi:hypothetical protein